MDTTVNRIVLLGKLGREPDLLVSTAGRKIAHCSLSTRTPDPLGPGREPRVLWHRLTFLDANADAAEADLHRSDVVYIEGHLEYDTYEKRGMTIPTTQVIVDRVAKLRGDYIVSLNRATIVGRLGRAPDVTTLLTGAKIAHLTVATGEPGEKEQWHRVVIRGDWTEDHAARLRPGDQVLAEGPIDYDTYERNGTTIPTSQIEVSGVKVIAMA